MTTVSFEHSQYINATEGAFQWGKPGNPEIRVELKKIPQYDSRVVGAQQFKRILQEFLQVSSKIELGKGE